MASARTHDLKVWPEFFADLWSKRKTFEVRVNDRAFQAGDRVRLWEYDQKKSTSERHRYTRRVVDARIGYVLAHSPVRAQMEPLGDGRVVFSLLAMSPRTASYTEVPGE